MEDDLTKQDAIDEPPPNSLFPWSKLLLACVGAVIVGVTVPVLLFYFHVGELPRTDDFGVPIPRNPNRSLAELVRLETISTVFCGPGAVILTLIMFTTLYYRYPDWSENQTQSRSAIIGAIAALANLPAWLVLAAMPHDETYIVARVLLLFAVAGGSAGLWIGWQVWRAAHPEAGFWPRFSLKTLLLVVFAWGVLLAIFAPR